MSKKDLSKQYDKLHKQIAKDLNIPEEVVGHIRGGIGSHQGDEKAYLDTITGKMEKVNLNLTNLSNAKRKSERLMGTDREKIEKQIESLKAKLKEPKKKVQKKAEILEQHIKDIREKISFYQKVINTMGSISKKDFESLMRPLPEKA